MTSLSPESQSIIDAARGADELDDVARERIKRGLFAQIAAGAAAAGTTAVATEVAAATKATGAALGAGSLTKIGVMVAVASAVGLGGYQVIVAEPDPAPTTRVAPAPTTSAAPAPNPAAPLPSPARAPEREAEQATAPQVEGPSTAQVEAKPSSVAPRPEARPRASSLAAETALLQQAQRELQAGNSEKALELLDKHGAEHHGGALREERQAARVYALCGAGRVAEGEAAAQRFVAEFPRSPHRARVLSACERKD